MRFATFVLTFFQAFHIHMRILRLNHSSVSKQETLHIGKVIIADPTSYVFFQLLLSLGISPPLLRLVSSFNLDFILALDFWMHRELAFAFHHIKGSRDISSAHTTLRSFSFVDFLRYRVFSINRVIELLHSHCSPSGLAEYHRVISIAHKG